MIRERELTVSIMLAGGETVRCGTLSEFAGGNTASRLRFTYAPDYLRRVDSVTISPDLPLVRGELHPPRHLPVFSGLRDAMPDAWGQRLVALEARRRGMPVTSSLVTGDLFLVPNNTRQGDLLVEPAVEDADVPPLAALEAFGPVIEEFELGDDPSDPRLLSMLPLGTSQGGARPKLAVRWTDGSLAIAKFPAVGDRWNVARWEAVAAELATASGLPVAPFTVVPLGGEADVFVTKRFDRVGERRIGYWSGQTLLQQEDTRGVSYVDLLSFVLYYAEDKGAAGERLFRQAAFSVLTGNVDDHFRNFGMLRGRGDRWRVAPAFDLNPFPRPNTVAATPLTGDDDPQDRQLQKLLDRHDDFRLSSAQAIAVLKEVEEGTRSWAEAARGHGLDAEAVRRMRRAFEGEQRDFVRDLPGPDAGGRGVRSTVLTHAPDGPRPRDREWIEAHERADGTRVRGHWRMRRRPGS